MGLRFRRSFRLFSRSGVNASVGRRGAWLTLGPRGARATVGIPGTGLSYTEQSPWARPNAHVQTSALPPGGPSIDVAELPRVDDIKAPPALPPRTASVEAALAVPTTEAHAAAASEGTNDEDEQGDPRLVLIALAIVAIVAIAALAWALLV